MRNKGARRGPHSDERWVLIPECSILGRPIIFGLIPLEGCPRPGMCCYRARLCEKEERDCWFARPMESKVIPFDDEAAVKLILASGRAFAGGPEPCPLILDSPLPSALKAQILQEFLEYIDELDSPANFVPDEIIAALKLLG